jgi:hypothetical protein
MLAADVAAVSDCSLGLDGGADARVGGALGGERENSLRSRLNVGILVSFILRTRTRRGLAGRERKSKAAFSFLQYSMHGQRTTLQNAPGKNFDRRTGRR